MLPPSPLSLSLSLSLSRSLTHTLAESTTRKSFLRTLRAIDTTLDMRLDVSDEPRLAALTEEFAARSEGVLTGIIGALDGVHVRIRKPSNGAGYYCRKG